MNEEKFASKDPQKDEEAIDALIRDTTEGPVKYQPGSSKEEIQYLRDRQVDEESDRILGKPKSQENILENDDVEEENPFAVDSRNKSEELASDHLFIVSKGGIEEKLYELISEEYPELGVSIDPEVKDKDGKILNGWVAVKVIPFESDKNLLRKILEQPILKVLQTELSDKETTALGQKLELEGLIPKGMTERAIARRYLENTKKYKKLGLTTEFEESDRRLQLMDTAPLTTSEVEAFLREAINRTLEEIDEN